MIKEKLPIHKQYLVISAPTSFRLVANNGTDIVERPAGVWQLDCFKLLPEKYMKNYPVFNLDLEYDESKIPDGFNFTYYFTNINLGDSLKGVSGDLVELSEYQFNSIKKLFNVSEDYPSYKILAKKELENIGDDFGIQFQFWRKIVFSKGLFLGVVLVDSDGKRNALDPRCIYLSSSEQLLTASMKIRYKKDYNVLLGNTFQIELTEYFLELYGLGLYPEINQELNSDNNTISFRDSTKINFESVELFLMAI